MRVLLLLLLMSCQTTTPQPQDTKITRSRPFQQHVDQLIARDAENKRWARLYLHEIDQAMMNDDLHAYVFFVGEYEKIPLNLVPEHLTSEPGYVESPSDLELFFRLRWFEQAIIMYKKQSKQ